jgi:lysyl-tRNA synthetase class 2
VTSKDSSTWAPSADPAALKARARLLALIRSFFAERGVLEVETPVLSAAGNSDPGLQQFHTVDGHWLRTSPEYPMKRLLAAGSGDIYELGRVFRAGEAGTLHNPEFSLLEWYRVGWSYEQLMDEVAELLAYCGTAFGLSWVVRHVTYSQWVEEHTGIDPLTAPVATITGAIERAGVDLAGLRGLDRDGWLDLLISSVVQPALDPKTLTLVSLYPASQAALARLHEPDPRTAERFEVFLGPVELANGYQELTDAEEQRRRFEAENARRIATGDARPVPLDEALLDALSNGLPDCSGVALGVDRLLMILTGAAQLDQVLAFPADRA